MSESRPQKRKIEFIESYWTGGELGSDYQWNDNHGELIRCKDCKHHGELSCVVCRNELFETADNWYCAYGERKEGR